MRAKPFSGKKKKAQLQEKRHQKQQHKDEDEEFEAVVVGEKALLSNRQPEGKRSNKLVSQWDTVGGARKPGPYDNPAYTVPISPQTKECLEVSFSEIYGAGDAAFSLPSRPAWSHNMQKEALEHQENAYFESWLQSTYNACPAENLSFFEHNLEVWRQLWRVCEMSDIVVIVVDVRHPVLNFPPSLYRYVVEGLGKRMCVALTKTDIVGEQVVRAWKEYILSVFPQLAIVNTSIYDMKEVGKEGKPKRYVSASGIGELVDALAGLSSEKFSPGWNHFREKCFGKKSSYSPTLEEDELLTIGMIGHPNAGKSSLINSIVGRKCVSASRTPGHTKHFQTIHLTKHIRLCDCPGLIFPMRVPKWLQILAGLYNVAQVRDPYEPLMHLAQYIDLGGALGVTKATAQSVLETCEAYAEKRGFFTAKAARPDIYRAANFILRSVIDGRLLLSWKPPGYYKAHPLGEEIRQMDELSNAATEDEEDASVEEEFTRAGVFDQVQYRRALIDEEEEESSDGSA